MNTIDKKYIELLAPQLNNFKTNKDKYNFSCPLCGDSKTNEKKARGWILSLDQNSSFFKCFNCGEHMSFKNFLKRIDENLYKQYVAEEYFLEGKTIELSTNVIKDDCNYISYNDFINNENIISCKKINNSSLYLRNRKIQKLELFYHTSNYGKLLESLKLEKYKDEFNRAEERLIIPHFNRDNNLAYIQFRNLDPSSKLRYKTYKIIEDEDKIWNLNNVDFNKNIYITEGALDASFLDNSLAMSGADFLSSNTFINNINKDKIHIIMDNEPRNPEIAKRYYKLAKQDFKVFLWPNNIKEKDINDCILDNINIDMFYDEKNYVSGIEGSIQLTEWIKVKI